MKIEHYNAIAKIVGGILDNNDKLNPMVNTLTNYFESVDENFDSKEFRSACLNGHYMEETPETDINLTEQEILPTNIQNPIDNWKPNIDSTVSRDNDYGFKEANLRMTDNIVKTHGNDNKVKR